VKIDNIDICIIRFVYSCYGSLIEFI